MIEKRRYLCMSNVRTGSTHLVTSLSALPGVYSDYEIKWRRLNPAAGHLLLDEDAPNFETTMSVLGEQTDIFGTKFIIDFASEVREGDYCLLGAALQDFVATGGVVSHLLRGYFHICISSLMRGNWNSISRSVPGMAKSFSQALPAIETELRNQNPDIEKGSLDRLKPSAMLKLLSSLLFNDCFYAAITPPQCEPLYMHYETLNRDIMRLARRLGIAEGGRKVLADLFQDPIVRKLSKLDPSGAPGLREFRALCDHADGLRDKVLSGEYPVEDLIAPLARKPREAPRVNDPIYRALSADFLAAASQSDSSGTN